MKTLIIEIPIDIGLWQAQGCCPIIMTNFEVMLQWEIIGKELQPIGILQENVEGG
jgi:hypothetical protein